MSSLHCLSQWLSAPNHSLSLGISISIWTSRKVNSIYRAARDLFACPTCPTAYTHEKGHTIDLIITRSSDQIVSSDPVSDELFSDHFSISCSLSFLKPDLEVKEVTIRPKTIDLQSFLDDITSSDLCNNQSDDPEVLLDLYNTTLKSIYDKHAPPKKKTITTDSSNEENSLMNVDIETGWLAEEGGL